MAKPRNLGAPHPLIPHLYRILPTTAAGQVYPHLRSGQPTPQAAQAKGPMNDASRSYISPLGGQAGSK